MLIYTEVETVPVVGKGSKAKHFPYTKAGEAAAKRMSDKTGMPMKKMPMKPMMKRKAK